jgi:hypothetical protein
MPNPPLINVKETLHTFLLTGTHPPSYLNPVNIPPINKIEHATAMTRIHNCL